MMNMKKILLNALFLGMIAAFGSCSDFFEIDTDTTLDNGDYISEENEIFTGFMGIISKMQAIGDKAIYLNEMRGEMMEPTSSAPRELYSLYNYDDDLGDNSYANPSGYYEVINACNDYLSKIKTYKEEHTLSESYYKPLVSSTLRIKAWTFMTLAKLYGEVVWVDKPMTSLRDLSKFKKLDIDQAMAACKNMLDVGFDDVDGTYETTWYKWLDKDKDEATSVYRYWDLMTPPYYAIYAEICLWLGKYQKCIDLIQTEMNERYQSSPAQNIAFLRNDNNLGKFSKYWDSEDPYAYEAVSAIMYNSNVHQTNSLLKHFDSDYPNKYWIAPSEAGMNRFSDPEFDPLGTKETDSRSNATFRKYNGAWVFCKYRPISSDVREAYQDDVHIYTYRGADLYFMLAEAFNELDKVNAVDAMINVGVGNYINEFEKDDDGNLSGTWYGFTPHWTTGSTMYHLTNGTSEYNSRKYGDRGIRGYGYWNMGNRPFGSDKYKNAKEILKEMVLEMSGEGKVYPALIRMSRRHKDNSFMADVISEKYEGKGNAEAIRTKIMNGDYFIHWDLSTEK